MKMLMDKDVISYAEHEDENSKMSTTELKKCILLAGNNQSTINKTQLK